YNIITGIELYILDCMAYCMIFMAVGVFVILLFEKLRYGRYSDSKYGFPVNAKFAWFVQEMPSFFVPLCLLVWASPAKTSLLPNQLLIAMYIFHYAQRPGLCSVPDRMMQHRLRHVLCIIG
uniref:Steroid 5-alpha reductase C-terminal domain-containing protein n=1 Tax=Monopterus albus TaxID=43700 RepID=A0A3Q3K8Q6_MONAL